MEREIQQLRNRSRKRARPQQEDEAEEEQGEAFRRRYEEDAARVRADAPPVPEVPAEELTEMVYRMDPIATYEESEPIPRPNWCLLCKYRQAGQHMSEDKFLRLVTYVKDNQRVIEPHEFLRTTQAYYDKHVRPYLTNHKGDQVRGPPWPAKQIWEHYAVHENDPNAMIDETLREFRIQLRALSSRMYSQERGHPERGLTVDRTANAQFTTTAREMRFWISMKNQTVAARSV